MLRSAGSGVLRRLLALAGACLPAESTLRLSTTKMLMFRRIACDHRQIMYYFYVGQISVNGNRASLINAGAMVSLRSGRNSLR